MNERARARDRTTKTVWFVCFSICGVCLVYSVLILLHIQQIFLYFIQFIFFCDFHYYFDFIRWFCVCGAECEPLKCIQLNNSAVQMILAIFMWLFCCIVVVILDFFLILSYFFQYLVVGVIHSVSAKAVVLLMLFDHLL